jgi:4a-hydroxytetrahydrobiopterin dehydratase
MSELANKQCIPCHGGVPAMQSDAIGTVSAEVPEWTVVNEHHLERTFTFDDFAGALAFVNRIGAMADAQGHHPDVYLSWGRVTLEIWTHAIDGLTESDFVFAAKADLLYR